MRCLIFLFFFSSFLNAQPGGGGGLKINRFFDRNFNEIKINEEKIVFEIIFLDNSLTILEKIKIDKNKPIYLGPSSSGHHASSSRNKGLIITFKNKKYRFDFENIMPENGAGVVGNIDSLVLFKPYILSKRSYGHVSHNPNEFRKYNLLYDLAYPFLNFGITPYSYKKLSELDLMFNSPDFAYNQKPKAWMEDFKNLYESYKNNKSSNAKIIAYIDKVNVLIEQYEPIPPFICLKILMLNELGRYSEIVELFKKYKFEYSRHMHFLNKILIQANAETKNYEEAILLSNRLASQFRETNKNYSYKYIFESLFVKVFYQDEDITKEIRQIFKAEEYPTHYNYAFEKFKILWAFNFYKFRDTLHGRSLMERYDKKMITNRIKQVMKI